MQYDRHLSLPALLGKRSHFLLGPRATGKTTLIRQQLPDHRVYDLLDSAVYRDLARRPRLLEEQTEPGSLVVIDEIQRLPELLNEVHRLIENREQRFLLTGSSARKLRSGGTNLLAGRAWRAELFPLTSAEIPDLDLLTYLNHGGLPAIHGREHAAEELRNYTTMYIQEEIKAEALTRSIPAFIEFLDLIALSNGEELNYESLASDCGVSPGTLKNYLQILEDTLIGFRVPAFTRTRKRKAISRAKHYLFDIGVVNELCRRGELRWRSELFGKALEQFVCMELRAYLGYSGSRIRMHYWRSTSMFEVDFVLPPLLALEVKSTDLVQDKHLKGLRALKEEGLIERYVVVSLDRESRRTNDGIQILPWKAFLEALWEGSIL